jgi:hypothetical protein
MTKHADITVYDTNNNLQLVVEVKNQPDVSAHWATQMRRNLLKHEFTPNAPYFLLVLPENFYLWKNSFLSELDAQPDYIVDTTEVLSAYFDPLPRTLNNISHDGLEMLMDAWIRHLVNSELKGETAGSELTWLFDSGLYETIKKGYVVIDI